MKKSKPLSKSEYDMFLGFLEFYYCEVQRHYDSCEDDRDDYYYGMKQAIATIVKCYHGFTNLD